MAVKILQKESDILRETASEVPLLEINSPKIQKVISLMKLALESQDDGVAIAAPQIGYPLRIFVVSHRVEELLEETKRRKGGEKIEGEKVKRPRGKDVVYINPTIKKISKERNIVEEGCLSVRYLYGKVKRSVKATVIAFDENGNKFERGGTDLMAQIFQHEIDHLNGVLFIDKAQDIIEIVPEHLKKNGEPK